MKVKPYIITLTLVFTALVWSSKHQEKKSKADTVEQVDVATKIKANNPVIKHIRTADPSAHIWNDGKVWMYTSHDKKDAINYKTIIP